MTEEQEVLRNRVQSILSDVQFNLAGTKYWFSYDPNRQLLYGHHTIGGSQVWTTRKWYISEHSTDSEILQTILKLCLTSAEHEAREAFTYRGKTIYGPHMDAKRLLEVADDTDEREPPHVPSTMPQPKVAVTL